MRKSELTYLFDAKVTVHSLVFFGKGLLDQTGNLKFTAEQRTWRKWYHAVMFETGEPGRNRAAEVMW